MIAAEHLVAERALRAARNLLLQRHARIEHYAQQTDDLSAPGSGCACDPLDRVDQIASPSSAKYSHCIGMITPCAQHRPLIVSRLSEGGQSIRMKSYRRRLWRARSSGASRGRRDRPGRFPLPPVRGWPPAHRSHRARHAGARSRRHSGRATPGIEPTNNLAEQAIRFVAIHRRMTQGTRGRAGQTWCERIWTAVVTCAQQSRSLLFFNSLPTPYKHSSRANRLPASSRTHPDPPNRRRTHCSYSSNTPCPFPSAAHTHGKRHEFRERIRRRYYSADIGRFSSRDPAVNYLTVDGWNVYEYVNGGPVGEIDPSGETGLGAYSATSSSLDTIQGSSHCDIALYDGNDLRGGDALKCACSQFGPPNGGVIPVDEGGKGITAQSTLPLQLDVVLNGSVSGITAKRESRQLVIVA